MLTNQRQPSTPPFGRFVMALAMACGLAVTGWSQAADAAAANAATPDGTAVAAADGAAGADAPVAADAAGDANTADAAVGETIFKNQCASCHNRNMKDNLTGPALGGVEERWAAYPKQDLYAWIRNSQGMVAQGHPRAVAIWAEWKPAVMSNFPALTDAEIEGILLYINNQYVGLSQGGEPNNSDVAAEVADAGTNYLLYGGLLAILIILSVVLGRVISNLRYMQAIREGRTDVKRATLVETLTSPALIGFVVFALILLGGYTTVNNAIELGRQQGYQPTQPVKFSHALHSGVNKIECQYCHDGARRSKHSVIPAANTCMNCHRAIKKGPGYGTAELTKIFASVGYDPTADKYIDNYEELSTDEIEVIYKKWIRDNYASDNGGNIGRDGEKVVQTQWEGIVGALTREDVDDRIPGPIEWQRIHNLPDHVYFNHAQHVAVGKLQCQNCHGPVQTMEEVYQYSPLSMGWCINCHRQTPVQFQENPYYQASYEQYHEELEAGTRQRVTVEDIGGIECQKCHY